MGAKQIPTGVFIQNEEIIAIELKNKKGTFVKIFNYGAILNQFIVKNSNEQWQDIVLGFENIESYLEKDFYHSRACLGTVVGRYANRIAGAKFKIADQEYLLDANVKNACLHGGEDGLDRKIWDIVECNEELSKVTLQYESLDGESKFPGTLLIELTFELTENDELILSYEADTDQASPVNLTHHDYFNLNDTGGSIEDHQLQIFADNYLEQDDNYVVTGVLLPVKDSMYDFTELKLIGKDWDTDRGYDQTFVLNKTYGDLTLAAKAKSKNRALTLAIYTTEPVVHFYTAKYLQAKKAKGGVDYYGDNGFCIETQHHPNAVHINSFPSTILEPGHLYTQTTIYKVSIEK